MSYGRRGPDPAAAAAEVAGRRRQLQGARALMIEAGDRRSRATGCGVGADLVTGRMKHAAVEDGNIRSLSFLRGHYRPSVCVFQTCPPKPADCNSVKIMSAEWAWVSRQWWAAGIYYPQAQTKKLG